jgi:hypothetical protein
MRFSGRRRTVWDEMFYFREEMMREQQRELDRQLRRAYLAREARGERQWWRRRRREKIHSPENDGGAARLPRQWPVCSPP